MWTVSDTSTTGTGVVRHTYRLRLRAASACMTFARLSVAIPVQMSHTRLLLRPEPIAKPDSGAERLQLPLLARRTDRRRLCF
jgi:hypothetical protein